MACSKRKTIICWETTNGNAANKRVMMSVVGGAKNTQKVAKKPLIWQQRKLFALSSLSFHVQSTGGNLMITKASKKGAIKKGEWSDTFQLPERAALESVKK